MQWNPQLDPQGWIRIFRSGLPLYWFPAFGPETHLGDLLNGRVRTSSIRPTGRSGTAISSALCRLGFSNIFCMRLAGGTRAAPIRSRPSTNLSTRAYATAFGRSRAICGARRPWFMHPGEMCTGGRTTGPRNGNRCRVIRTSHFSTLSVSQCASIETCGINFTPDRAGSVRIFRVLLPDDYQPAMQSILRHILTEFPMATQQRSSGVNQ
jgi:hypothetical protein